MISKDESYHQMSGGLDESGPLSLIYLKVWCVQFGILLGMIKWCGLVRGDVPLGVGFELSDGPFLLWNNHFVHCEDVLLSLA